MVTGGAAQHVVLRSRGVQCFSSTADCLLLLDLLCVLSAHYECTVHAYALMHNHVHLLVTTGVALDLTRAVRFQYRSETGARIEDEYVRPIHARRYLLACMRYIELNPVRANIVALPESYRWSSYRANALGYTDAIVRPHALYYALGRSPEARRAAYTRFVRSGFPRPDSVSP